MRGQAGVVKFGAGQPTGRAAVASGQRREGGDGATRSQERAIDVSNKMGYIDRLFGLVDGIDIDFRACQLAPSTTIPSRGDRTNRIRSLRHCRLRARSRRSRS